MNGGMEQFALAAISLSIALALVIRKRKSKLIIAYAFLCFALFVARASAFFSTIVHSSFWDYGEFIGLLFVPPLLVSFGRYLLHRTTFLSRHVITFLGLLSLVILIVLFTPLAAESFMATIIILYVGASIVFTYAAFVYYVRITTSGVERTRILYVVIACAAAAVLSLSDLLHHSGVPSPFLADIAVALLLYFVMIVISYPELPELYEMLLKAVIIFCIIVFTTIVFYLIIGFFGDVTVLPFTSVIFASFIIVIFIDPVKIILQRIFSHFFFDKKEISVSLYPIDEKIEREKMHFLEEMATGFAHEIRNPLGSIKGAAQYLKSSNAPENREKLLSVIIDEVDRLNRVVSQFLNYARPSSLSVAEEDVNRIVDKVITLLKTEQVSGGVSITKTLDPDIPPLNIDGEQFMQVILNIALNAVEAMPEGGVLSFTTQCLGDDGAKTVAVSIADTGRGMEPEEIRQIFKPFYTGKKKGTGLGLSISEKIVKRHGGVIEVASTPGAGTVFSIKI